MTFYCLLYSSSQVILKLSVRAYFIILGIHLTRCNSERIYILSTHWNLWTVDGDDKNYKPLSGQLSLIQLNQSWTAFQLWIHQLYFLHDSFELQWPVAITKIQKSCLNGEAVIKEKPEIMKNIFSPCFWQTIVPVLLNGCYFAWGPFLESPENFSGPKSHS